MSKNQFLRGTFFLSSASLISKILGFIYIIPFTAFVGTQGYALYKYAYGPYTIMLSISTMGIPLAISKMISKYHHLQRKDIEIKILKFGFIFMLISGIASYLLLNSFAVHLARIVVDDDSSGNSISEVTYVIKLVSYALIIIPPMSLLRGFFQGYQSMGPSALSTITEQFIRVIFIILGTYTALNLFHTSIKEAVGVGTFGAFVGGVAGLIVLLLFLFKRKKFLFEINSNYQATMNVSIRTLFKEMISYSIPFVIVGLSIPLYQNIDTFTINSVLNKVGYPLKEAEIVNSVIGLAQILVLIPVSLTTGLSMSIIPSITSDFVNKNYQEVNNKINQSLLILFLLIMPMGLGLMSLSEPLYLLMFGPDNSPVLGGQILKLYSPAAILIALYGITCSIMQAVNLHKQVIFGLFIGLSIKLGLNFILPQYFLEQGFIFSTYFGFAASLIYNLIFFNLKLNYSFKKIRFRMISILISSLLMCFIIIFFSNGLSNSIKLNGTFDNLIITAFFILLGICVYFTGIYLTNREKFKNYIKFKNMS
ncbi:putative polysaccharide biosynthesis protein [Cytobacillus firmus]|uniref:putative polysaccharide biosynthesis protein n=1 Tax=Cytobacillus firmus TaxID=1399 RepID=UPI0030012E13